RRRPARGDDDYIVIEDGGFHAVPDDGCHVRVVPCDLPLHTARDLDWPFRAGWRWRDVRSADAHRPIGIAFERAKVFTITHSHSFRQGVLGEGRSLFRWRIALRRAGCRPVLSRHLFVP